MNYRKISQNSCGLKGMELHYTEPNDKGIPVLTKVYPKSVVHLALQKKFKDLRKHLLDICGQVNADMEDDIAANYAEGAIVRTVEFDGDKIFLQGEWERFEGKFIPLETCWIESSDEYHAWDELKQLVDDIKEETTAYFEGSVKVSDAEAVYMWANAKHKEEEFSMDKLLALPPEQLAKMATLVVEKGLGGVVMLPEDQEIDVAAMGDVVEELKDGFSIDANTDSIDMGVVKSKDKKVTEPEI